MGEQLTPKRQPTCSRCGVVGHARTSRLCLRQDDPIPSPLQRPSTSDSDLSPGDQLAGEMALLRTPSSASRTGLRLPAPGDLTESPTTSRRTDLQATAVQAITVLEDIPEEDTVDPRPLAPSRPELLIQSYQQEKSTWLAAHPKVRPTNYRKARKWRVYNRRQLDNERRFMPLERRDTTTKKPIPGLPKWTEEEVYAYIDNHQLQTEATEREMEQEFRENGGRLRVTGIRNMWNDAGRRVEQEARDFIV